MAQMKQFGLELADLIYDGNMENKDIIALMESKYQGIDREWLQQQIDAVRDHPETWNYKHVAYPGYPHDIDLAEGLEAMGFEPVDPFRKFDTWEGTDETPSDYDDNS